MVINISILPNELLIKIFERIPPQELFKQILICKRIFEIIKVVLENYEIKMVLNRDLFQVKWKRYGDQYDESIGRKGFFGKNYYPKISIFIRNIRRNEQMIIYEINKENIEHTAEEEYAYKNDTNKVNKFKGYVIECERFLRKFLKEETTLELLENKGFKIGIKFIGYYKNINEISWNEYVNGKFNINM